MRAQQAAKLSVSAFALWTLACAAAPHAPSPVADTRSSPIFGFGTIHAVGDTLITSAFALCLSGSGEAACFARPTPPSARRLTATAVGTPASLVATVTGSNVTLSWNAVASVSAYIIEAGSGPGLANLANFSTGNTATTFSATGVGAGTYYVRVRALGIAGEISVPSNEILVVVGPSFCVPPGSPSGLTLASQSAGTVVLAWTPGSGNPTSYVVEAGSGAGLANVANVDLNSPTPGLTATNVGAGTYYVRVRSKNACGVSAPSNEIVFTINIAPIPAPTPSSSFGPGQYLVGRGIAAGRYYSSPRYGCYWERQSGLSGSLYDIIENDFVGYNASQYVVDILRSDLAFLTDADCGTWFSTPRQGFQSSIPPGGWLVNVQLSPGTYRAFAQYGCYWERRRDFTNSLVGIIANNFVSFTGSTFVAISSSDTGFVTDADCGTWSRVAAITSEDQAETETQSSADKQQLREYARQRRRVAEQHTLRHQ